jgi:hypothetical protein
MAIVKLKRVTRGVNWGLKENGQYLPKYSICTDRWVPGLNAKTGVLNTGLSKEDEKYFEKELGLDEGKLSKSSKFWDDFDIIIPSEGLVLDTDSPSEDLKYRLLCADKFVAKNTSEAAITANIEYILTSDEDEAKSKNKVHRTKQDAWVTFAKLSDKEISDTLSIMGQFVSEHSSSEINRDRLSEIVDKNPSKFLSVCGDALFKDKVLFMEMIRKGVIVRKVPTLGYDNVPLYYGEIHLGNGLTEAITFCKQKENQQVIIGMKKDLKAV